MLIGADSTVYLRTSVCRLVIPLNTLAAAVDSSTKTFRFEQGDYEANWQLFTLASGFDGSEGMLQPYTGMSISDPPEFEDTKVGT